MFARVSSKSLLAIAIVAAVLGAFQLAGARDASAHWAWLILPLVLLAALRSVRRAQPGSPVVAADPEVARIAARQHEALSALAEIDRAVLSSASTERIIQALLRKAPPVIGCDVFAVTMMPADAQPQPRTLVVRAGGEAIEHRPQCDLASVQSLSSEPQGRWLENVASHPIGSCMAAQGARHVLLIPVFVDAVMTAVVAIGVSRASALSDEGRTYAADFAARLGVALTASTHRENHYLEGHYDSLTRLPNRRSLTERLTTEISRAQRDSLRLALVFINLDEFKKVNDAAGYGGGDAVLREAAARLKACLREQDFLARYGADEFLAVLPGIAADFNAGRVAEKLSAVLCEPFALGGEEYHLGASIGVSLYPEDGRDAAKLLHSADVAMSRAKTGGAGRIMFFEERINSEVASRAALERDLRQAVHQHQLTVEYQPMMNISSGKVVGAEALLRWRHPQRGVVTPGEFIAIAEQSSLIEQMGDFVRQTVCRQYQSWVESGVAPSRISLNVSSREISRPDFVEHIEALLRETGMRPFCLELEITETLLVDNSSRALKTLKRLHEKGVRIAIDDFGTGYSSLAYLRHMPFDVLKIDRAFVAELGKNQESDSIVAAIVAIARSLGKELVAEGVETEQQRAALAQKGVEIGQGFLWSKATSPERYADMSRASARGAVPIFQAA
jgi:diguanylate cyclase (GGDEF)-like protein